MRDFIDHDSWVRAYLSEIEYYAALTPGRTVTSIFFGGGTPSLMAPQTVAAVIDAIQKNWHLANDCEITLEANPTSTEAGKFRAFRDAGVNRVSIGVQALDDAALRFLGRRHSAAEALRALAVANENFERVSFDLIYARPGQGEDEWRNELAQASALAKGHISMYQLTIEQGTPFFVQYGRGDFSIPDDDQAGALYEITQAWMEAQDMPAYEISNHAAPGQESLHNLAYWRYQDYAGIGPGAHGRLTIGSVRQATRGHRAPEIWLDKVKARGHGGHPFEAVESRQRLTECLMMGLRLREGVPLARLAHEAAEEAKALLDSGRLKALAAEGLLEVDAETIRATAAGRQRLNGVLKYLLSAA